MRNEITRRMKVEEELRRSQAKNVDYLLSIETSGGRNHLLHRQAKREIHGK